MTRVANWDDDYDSADRERPRCPFLLWAVWTTFWFGEQASTKILKWYFSAIEMIFFRIGFLSNPDIPEYIHLMMRSDQHRV